jgi:hypothetical protein
VWAAPVQRTIPLAKSLSRGLSSVVMESRAPSTTAGRPLLAG